MTPAAALAALLLVGAQAFAQQAPSPPTAPPPPLTAAQADELARTERFRSLAAELRCLVCQNQTLAESNAELAGDLRNEVLRQIAAGRDDRQIKEHLVARYGEFVLYRPEMSARNLALWAGPAVLMLIGAVSIWRLTRRPAAPAIASAAPDDARLARIDRLLGEDPAADPVDERQRS
jgi:cytochrome c-type biogenesis protein CcmH